MARTTPARMLSETQANPCSCLAVANPSPKKLAFYADIDKHFLDVNTSIVDIAKKHGKKEKVVRAIVSSRSQFKAQHAPSLRNAIIHDMAVKAHADGDRKLLEDYQDELQEGIDSGAIKAMAEAMDEEEKKRLINQLLLNRELNRRGVCASNKAALVDGRQTASRIGDALIDLHERTNIRGPIFSRGNADDDAPCPMLSIQTARWNFSPRYWESLCLTSSGNMSDGAREKNDVNSVRKQVSAHLVDTLRAKITKKPRLNMEYATYDNSTSEKPGASSLRAGPPT
ncbi:hypothetical protein B0H14DRAFT_3515732 [Mycena olivaceomarginata]|nr:hypothetical protein B0H14DRAFT_3515732 [Mycena olivaceomarginata]